MPEIKNTFLKGRMNQDLDSRILPEGEYREAINLLISRSEGSTVGEFENILGNSVVGTLSANKKASVIGSFADETNNRVYLFATDFSNSDASSRAATTNTCFIIEFDLDNPASPTVLVNGYWLNFNKKFPIYGVNLLEDLLFWTDNFNQPRKINVTTARNNPTAYTEEMQISVAKYYPCLPVVPVAKTKATVAAAGNTTTNIRLTASAPSVKVGDIVTDFDQTDVSNLAITNTLPPVRVVEVVDTVAPFINFKVSPAITPGALASGTVINFTRTSMSNDSDQYVSNYSIQTIDNASFGGNTMVRINANASLGGIPRVGDIVTNLSVPDAIPNLNHTNAAYRYPLRISNVQIDSVSTTNTGRWTITFDKDMTAGGNLAGIVNTNQIAIGNNENYDSSFKGDSKYLDDKFVRFSYRFKFNDNEYSLMAPFSNIMFIPKQQSQFNLGQIDTKVNDINNYYQDETDAYTSTIIEWFENDVDTIDVKIPLPDTISNLINKYKIQKIDVLYKESDGLAVKVLDTIDLSTPNLSLETIEYNNDINGLLKQRYYNYNYKSNKPYKTLPQNQTTRVYDKVPIRALAQEVSSNRVIYGNFVEKMTPPSTIPYSVSYGDRDMESSDYAALYPHQTVKQNRTYQVGFVLVDYYGRQSDVILSSYDSDNTKAGSSVYVPYRDSGEATTTPIINWLGNTLKLNIDSSFGENKNFESGEPGLYREHGYAESIIAITDSDSDYEANTSYRTSGGSGSGCIVRVTSVGGSGEITGLTIINAGSGYTQGNELTVTGGGGSGTFTINTGVANPLGWYSYKVVVKQQEQEYYNVYLPGFVNGLPIQNQVWDGTTSGLSPSSFDPIETQRGKIFFSTVLSENINKIPRNLNEVGPTDREFNSEEVIYIRVNNPNATKDQQVRNLQYYPGQISQNVLNLSTVKETELAAVPFQPFRTGYTIYSINVGPTGNQGDYGGVSNYNTDGTDASATQSAGRIPYGDVGDKQSFYAADQNPFIMKVGQVENFGNPIGAIVCGKGEGAASGGNYPIPHDTNWNSSTAGIPGTPSQDVRNMEPILSIAETKPVYSVLELFYETAMTGKLETLNGMIDTNYNGAVRINASSGSFSENTSSGTNIGPQFKFINGSGSIIPYASIVGTPVITKVYRQNDSSQTNVPGLFSLVQTTNDQYSIRTTNTFWYGTSSNANPSSDVYIFDIQVTSGTSPQYVDDLPTSLTLSLSNAAPKMYSDSGLSNEITSNYAVSPNPAVNATNIVQLYGVNGSASTANRGEQLVWTIGSLAPGSGGSTSDFSISSTGLITSNATMTNEGTYGLVVNLIDVNNTGSNKIAISRTITWTAGTAYAPKAIGTGQVAPLTQYNMAGTGNSGEYIFADVPDNYVADGSGSPFGSAASSVFNIKKLYNNSAAGSAACSGNATADLFQGTIKITPKLFNTTTAAGDINVLFSIQHRSNSSSSWSSINSVSGAGLDVWTASTSTVQLSKSTGSAGSVSKNYRFDQLGEYRVLTSGLGGDQSTHAKFEVEFQDGAYGLTTVGPCQE
jgi:hypothetical protein